MVDFCVGCLVVFMEFFFEFVDYFRCFVVCILERIDIISCYKFVVFVGYGFGQLQQCESNLESGMVFKLRELLFLNIVRIYF